MSFLIRFTLITLFSMSFAQAYELVIIQGLSQEKQTFVTRGGKNKGHFVGRNVTFTSNDVSVIAKALTVSREFTQWEIKNDFSEVPFRRGEIVTMYDTTEYLWALNPGKAQRKSIKNYTFKNRRSLEAGIALSRGISESTSEAVAQNISRGGFQFEGMFRKEVSYHYAFALGLRYAQETLNTPSASLVNQRFLGVIEGRYYFDQLPNFYLARIGLSLGLGFGQSRTTTSGQASFGNAVLLPSTKISLSLPIDKTYDAEFFGAFESLRLDEGFASGADQTTNLINSKVGVMFRKHI